MTKTKALVVEQSLGIPADYQYKALRSRNFLQANWHNNKLDTLEKLIQPGMRVLDLGTGSGNFEFHFSHRVKEIVGVDYNSEAIGFLRKSLKKLEIRNVTTIQSDIRQLYGKGITGKFDLIVMIDVIEHIRYNEAEKVIKNIRSFLKPSGKICIITPNYRSTWLIIEEILDKYKLVPHLKGEQHLAKYDAQNLDNLFRKNGYKTREIKSFNLISYLFPTKTLAKFLNHLEMQSNYTYGNLLWGLFELK